MSNSIIDAHNHFWKYDPVRDAWITEDMKEIQRDFLPPDLETLLRKNNVAGTVVVQSDQSESENIFQLENADRFPFILGVVGWLDLQAENLKEKLEFYKNFPKLKGFRHVLQGEKQRDFMLRPAFQQGIGLLNQYDYCYDLLILPDQLACTEKLVASFPDQRFVIDHLAKPLIKEKKISAWKTAIKKFGNYPNVYCKISGLVTEADLQNWRNEDFRPYLDVVVESFGMKKIMFGSDWPVCLLAAEYEEVKQITEEYFSSFSQTEQSAFFGENARSFYKL